MKRTLILTFFAAIFFSACSLPSAPSQNNGGISTAAALTVQAVLTAATPAAPLETPMLTTPVPSTTMPALTPTSSAAMASVADVTNCRSGPGKDYDRVAQILPNTPVKIVGYFPSTYWIVTTANGDCWLAAEFTTPSGAFGAVPRVTAPPTPLGGAPEAPTFPKNGWVWWCNGAGQTDVTLNWSDNADNETGYRIYRNDELVTELPADATVFKETVVYPGGEGLKYKVEAFNSAGASSVTTATMFCD